MTALTTVPLSWRMLAMLMPWWRRLCDKLRATVAWLCNTFPNFEGVKP
jgi:hypothetical protein